MKLAHDQPIAGHLGTEKTKQRILASFYWPGLFQDVSDYCAECDTCQKVAKRIAERAPMVNTPIITDPFSKIAMDIVGPLNRTTQGNKYILTVIDEATRYPEAFALPSCEAERIADTLITLFSRVGIPKTILTDQGSNFTSALLKDLYEKIKIKGITTTPYHQQANGKVERFNGTLKSMLKKLCMENGEDWDVLLPYVLFAYREVPHEETGFSPFDLLYGWPVCGPLSVLKSFMTGEEEIKTSEIDHVVNIRNKLADVTQLVQNNLEMRQSKIKDWYDRSASKRTLRPGDEVLVLTPDRTWQDVRSVERTISCGTENEIGIEQQFPNDTTETISDLVFGHGLTQVQRQSLRDVCQKFSRIFTSKPGKCDVISHTIKTMSENPITERPYRIPEAKKQEVKESLNEMLEQGLITPSKSPWASPIVLVNKPDGTIRICVDYRKLNEITLTDPYPIPRMSEVFEKIGSAKYLSRFDLTKGYWQVPLAKETREKSAFITPFGLFEFTVMPFGMKTSPASFIRLMDRILDGTQNTVAYFDDIIVYSQTWEDHIKHVTELLQRIHEANLTIRPSKYIGNYADITVPLTDLPRKSQPAELKWTEREVQSFKKLKEALMTAPVLVNPNFNLPFVLQTDASNNAIGAVLEQMPDGDHPVAYLSKKLLPREKDYSTIEKELLAIVWAIGSFSYYLEGRKFYVETDHNPLTWLHRLKNKNQRLLRWARALQSLTIRMKNCQFLTIFLCLPIQVMPWVFHVKNMTNLHSNYLDHCDSGFLCSEMNKTNASTSESSEKQNCPVCLCTHDCEVKGQCCPDKSLSKCIQPDYFLNQKYYVESDRFMMVSACPQRYGYLEDDCLLDLNPSSFQHLAPVISLKTNITYANAKCAKCHGESEFIEWPSSVICFQKDFDVNIYSDVDGLWEGMNEYDCVLEYFPPPGSSLALCKIRSLVSECNVTGEWDVFDEDLETACKNYWNQYGVFQNVFCFLCNTGVDQRKLYRTQYNIYKGNMTIQQDFFDEGVTIIEEWNKFNKQYKAKLTLLSLDVLENVKQMLKERNQTSDSKISENLVNMTALFTEYVRSGGYQDWCQEDHQVQKIHPGFRSRRNCTCDQNCYKSASCCPDAAYNHTMACFLPFLGQKDDPKPNEAFFVISRCPKQYEDVFIKSNCEKSLDFEIFDIPVINVKTKEAYKNHYCYLCHHQEDIFKNTTTEIKAWNITIVCPSLLFPMFVPSIALLLQAAKSKQCFIYFTTIFHLEFCDENNFSIIQKCNATGMVESVSQDVLTMCEDPLMNIMAKSRNYLYKNQICDVCNTEVYEEPLGVCTDPDFDYLGTICEYGELDLDYYPYENIFCMQCNPFDKGGGKLDPVSGMRSYRNIFSIFDTEERDEQTTTECKESEFLDVFTKTCRKLYCSPGKYLQDSSCQFFITETQLVSYTMAFKISIFSNSSESNIYSILENLKKFIQPEITEGYTEFIDYYFYSNKPCNELKISLQNLTIEEEAMIYLQMRINALFPDSLNRTITEEHVMNLPKLTINLQGVSLTFQESLEAWYIPFMYNRKTTKSCLERISTPVYESKNAFDVNNLLTCTQIQIERNEYNFLRDGIRVYIPCINLYFI
ncbi:uncharacterized protein LOC134256302, partial [Saccostrea cucullata]|uniref:uncharacterized protein LOC134256302 n=1 Tax=Saccostrea cuccullata TaxID=36930 RepID=UPI002ED675AA